MVFGCSTFSASFGAASGMRTVVCRRLLVVNAFHPVAQELRQSDRQLNLPPDQAVDRQRRLDALAREEANLADTSQHLAARTESQFGRSAVGSLGDRLRQSEYALRDAESALQENAENTESEVPKSNWPRSTA